MVPSPKVIAGESLAYLLPNVYELWTYHRTFPWRLLAHLLLLLAITGQTLLYCNNNTAFVHDFNLDMYHNFLPDRVQVNMDDRPDVQAGRALLYSIPDLVSHMESVVDRYHKIKWESITKYNYASMPDDDGPPNSTVLVPPMRMTFRYYTDAYENIFNPLISPDYNISTETITVDQTNLGPYDLKALGRAKVRKFLHVTKEIALDFTLYSFHLGANYRSHIQWDVRLTYANPSNGPFSIKLSYESQAAKWPQQGKYPEVPYEFALVLLTSVTLLLLAGVHMVLCVRDVAVDITWLIAILRGNHLPPDEAGAVRLLAGEGKTDNEEAYFNLDAHDRHNPEFMRQVQTAEQARLAWVLSYPKTTLPPPPAHRGGFGNSPSLSPFQQLQSPTLSPFRSRSRGLDPQVPPRLVLNAQGPPMLSMQDIWQLAVWPTIKKRFFLLNFIANAACILLGLVNLAKGTGSLWDENNYHRLTVAVACAFTWFGLIQWLGGRKNNSYVIVRTLRRGIPRVMVFMVGVFPTFMGYALFGMLFFGNRTGRFSTLVASMFTLFSMLNGDILRDTFLDLYPIAPMVSQLYLYTFISFFIYCVLAVFVAIMEHAYEHVRVKYQNEEPSVVSQLRATDQGDQGTTPMRSSRNPSVEPDYSAYTPPGHKPMGSSLTSSLSQPNVHMMGGSAPISSRSSGVSKEKGAGQKAKEQPLDPAEVSALVGGLALEGMAGLEQATAEIEEHWGACTREVATARLDFLHAHQRKLMAQYRVEARAFLMQEGERSHPPTHLPTVRTRVVGATVSNSPLS